MQSIFLKFAFFNIFRKKTRTFLAILSITIGLAALIVLISLVNGIYMEYASIINKMNGVLVFNKSVPDPSMAKVDVSYINKLSKIKGIKHITPEAYHTIRYINGKKIGLNLNALYFLYGVNPKDLRYCAFSDLIDKLIKGRFPKVNEKNVIALPKEAADEFNIHLGEKINIDGKKYKVIGIFEMENKLMGLPLFVNIEDMKKQYNCGKKVNAFYLTPLNPKDSEKIAEQVKFKFKDLQAQDKEEMQKQMASILDKLKLLALLVSLISSFIAALSVINTVLMSIIERYKEIGTLKAIGWTKENIIFLIILESIFISIFGTIFGLIFGFIISYLLQIVLYLPVFITLTNIFEIIIFGLLIGIFSGIYPAYVAAKKDPIKALRGIE